MAVEIYMDAPNGDEDRLRIKKSFEEKGYTVLHMQLRTLIPSTDQYFCVVVEEYDPVEQSRTETAD